MEKNITGLQQFLARHWYGVGFVIVCIISAVLLLYKLGEVPHGMTWDEAAIGYNGYAIWHSRRDEWLNRLPISFKSFGDYKAPFAIYLSSIFTAMLGLNLFAVRLPFALIGLPCAALMMLLVRKILKPVYSPQTVDMLSLAAGVIVATEPWYVHFSRIAFESGIASSFLLLGVCCFFWMIDETKNIKRDIFLAIAAALSFGSALYAYHSAKIVGPLLGLTLLLFYLPKVWKKKSVFIVMAVVLMVFLTPLMQDFFFAEGATRLNQVSIFNLGLPPFTLFTTFISNYFAHLSPSFLTLGQTPTLRHGDGQWGVVFPTTFLLLICSLILLVQERKSLWKTEKLKIALFALAWIAIGILPAAIGKTVPNGNRASLAAPGFTLFAILFIPDIIRKLQNSRLNQAVSGSKNEKDLLVKTVVGMFCLLYVFFSLSYLHHYYTDYARNSADAFQDGYLEAMKYVDQEKNKVSKIIFTTKYGEPYIFALFERKMSPFTYQGGGLNKFEFNDAIDESFRYREDAIIVATPAQMIPWDKNKVIYGSDGKPKFVIIENILK